MTEKSHSGHLIDGSKLLKFSYKLLMCFHLVLQFLFLILLLMPFSPAFPPPLLKLLMFFVDIIFIIIIIIIIVLFIVTIIGKMIIQALPEIPTEGLTLDDVDELMEKTRKVMCETFESLVTEVNRQ
jgi:hypothetical protein